MTSPICVHIMHIVQRTHNKTARLYIDLSLTKSCSAVSHAVPAGSQEMTVAFQLSVNALYKDWGGIEDKYKVITANMIYVPPGW
jgi:hypothetical protein